MLRVGAGLLAIVIGAGCPSTEQTEKTEKTEKPSKKKKKKKKSAASAAASASASAAASASGAPTSSASAAPPLSPALAAIAAGRWKDPDGGPDINLTTVSLAKCYGFKGYSMKLPEGSTIQSILGSRNCMADLPGVKKKGYYSLLVESDELKVKRAKKDELKNVVEKTWDEPDAFLFKVDYKGKPMFYGWWEAKLGSHTIRCNSIMSSGQEPFSFDVERAIIELCRTLKYE